jgi:hypothetical protein
MHLFGRRILPNIRNRNGVTDAEHIHDIEQKLRLLGLSVALPGRRARRGLAARRTGRAGHAHPEVGGAAAERVDSLP